MHLIYLAHACFKIDVDGHSFIFDPYKKNAFNGAVKYSPVNESADVLLISHHHEDHDAVSEVRNVSRVIDKPGMYEDFGCQITGISSFHDARHGAERGENTVFIVQCNGIKIAHLGDQGFVDEGLIEQLKGIDVLLIPVGGVYTIDPKEATEFVNKVEDIGLIVPMHYKTSKIDFPISPVDEFLDLNRDKQILQEGPKIFLPAVSKSRNKIVVMSMARL